MYKPTNWQCYDKFTYDLQLALSSDVLVENYLPGKLASMGLGYKQLADVNPRLVYCSITGEASFDLFPWTGL